MLSLIVSFITKKAAYLGGLLTALWMFVRMIKKDASQEWAIEALKEAQRANEEAARARRASINDSDRGGLLKDDGYRRD